MERVDEVAEGTKSHIGFGGNVLQQPNSQPAIVVPMGHEIAGPHGIGHVKGIFTEHEVPAKRAWNPSITDPVDVLVRIPHGNVELTGGGTNFQLVNHSTNLEIGGKPLRVCVSHAHMVMLMVA